MLIGNLGADPEIRRLPSGGPVANFRMACTESWKDKDSGEKRESTEWVSVVCFNEGICRVIEQYTQKGSKVYVEGKYKTRQWEKDGVKHYSTEVHIERFNGSLLLLSGQGTGGGSSDRDSQYDDMDRGRYGDRSAGNVQRGGSPNDSGHGRRDDRGGPRDARDRNVGGQGRYSDLDDDIPF